MFQLGYSTDRSSGSSLLELQLGKTRQWTRMLRGQSGQGQEFGQDLDRIPGFYADFARPSNGSNERDMELQEWRFDRFVSRQEKDGQDYYYAQGTTPFCGQPVGQVSAERFCQPDFLAVLIEFLLALCRQFEKLGYQQSAILWHSLLYEQKDTQERTHRFLLLPPEWLSFVSRHVSPEAQREHIIPYQLPVRQQNPEPNNSQRWTYALAVLLFTKLCGELPFRVPSSKNYSIQNQNPANKSDEKQLHDAVMAMYDGYYVRAQLFCPRLRNSWDQFLQHILCTPQYATQEKSKISHVESAPVEPPPNESTPRVGCVRRPGLIFSDLSNWQQILKDHAGNSQSQLLWRSCSEEQLSQIETSLVRECRKRDRIWKQRAFWHTKRNTLAIGFGLIIAISMLIYEPIRQSFRPPEHYNYSAYDTVMQYYQAINRLDPQLHSEIIYKGNNTIKADGDMLAVLFVNIQTRRGYEGRNVLLPAEDWLAKNKLSAQPGSPIPAVSLNFVPYGITDLTRLTVNDKGFSTVHNDQLILESPLELMELMPGLQDGTQVMLKIRYNIWLPGSLESFDEPNRQKGRNQNLPEALQPLHRQNIDTITLIYRARKQAWYIHKIQRVSHIVEHPLP